MSRVTRSLSWHLLRRVALVAAAIFAVAIVLALWRAGHDIDREEDGAAELARVVDVLRQLREGPASDVDAQLGRLRDIAASHRLRHLHLQLVDADDNALLPTAAPASSSLVRRWFVGLLPSSSSSGDDAVSWTIHRDDGRRYTATLVPDPVSEQDEALTNLLGLLLILAGYAVASVLAIAWALRGALRSLDPLHAAIAGYRGGDYTRRIPALPVRELDDVGAALNHLAATLTDVQDARRLLSLKLLTLQEDERSHIARELHDELGQILTALRFDTAWLLRRTVDQADIHAVAAELAAHGERIHLELRDLLQRLRPQSVAGDGEVVPLVDLLQGLVASWNQRPGNRTDYQLMIDGDPSGLERDLALALYRISQEALTNAARHAGAATVRLQLVVEGDAVSWSVQDDGIGVDATATALHRGNGLAGISERVWTHHGEIEIGPNTADASRPGLRLQARFTRSGSSQQN